MNQPTEINTPEYIGFSSVQEALNHQATHGGWIFESECGASAICFNATYTPTKIITHPATKGLSGRLR